jgi:hypothetical protein
MHTKELGMSLFKSMTVAAGVAVAILSAAPAFAGASTGTWKYSPREIRHQQMRERYEPRGYYQGRHTGWQRGRHNGWDRRY